MGGGCRWSSGGGGTCASSDCFRFRAWPFSGIALERHRRFSVNIQSQHRNISVIVAVMSSAVGGYLAARLRTKWVGVYTHEAFFRDTAHGFLAWAFATLLSASALSSATSYLANGTSVGLSGAALQETRSVNPAEIYVDKLFRTDAAAQPASDSTTPTPPASSSLNSPASGNPNPSQTRAEVLRLWMASFRDNQDLSGADKAYVTGVVAARTGMSQADAEKRVNDVITEAKTAADNARKGAAKLSFWLTAAMLFGAFAASLAAAEVGSLRDGKSLVSFDIQNR
jgi:hypothetical protein